MHQIIDDIAFCIIAAWALGVLAQFFRQPVILAYLIGGFAIGPSGFEWVHGQESVATISELGLIFLLFMIGLEIDLKKIISAGTSILVTGASQILGGAVAGVAFFYLIGFPLSAGKWDALYLGIAAALSSTVIIVKVLYDKQELDTLPGRVTLGVLVLQDLLVILFLAVVPNLDNLRASALLLSFARAGVLVATALTVSRFLLPPLFRSVARLPELVLVGALAWCFLMGDLAARLQLSREMGALIAGVSLSTFPYALDVTAKVTSLRDFFVTLFFVGLGMSIPVPSGALIGWALLFGLFAVASRLITTFAPLYLLRQGLRASLLPAINLSQISEFSLVVLALGLEKNHIAPESKGLVSFAFVLLATLSTFAMMNSDQLARAAISSLKRFGVRDLDGLDPARQAEESGQHGHGQRRANSDSRLFSDSEFSARRIAAQQTRPSRRIGGRRFQPSCPCDPEAAGHQGDLRGHQPSGDVAPCRRGLGRDPHLHCSRRAAQRHDECKACPAPARNQSQRKDHRGRRHPGRRDRPLCGRRRLRERGPARRGSGTLRGA